MAESIKIEIQGIDQFSPTFQAITKALQTVEHGADRTASGFSRLQAAIITANQSLDLMQRVLGPVIRGLGSVLETAGRFERLDMMLKRVEGSAEGAAKAKARLLQITNELPISLETVTRAYVKLQTLGYAESERLIRSLTNATAAFGGTELELSRAITAVQQMIGKGVVSMEELRQQLGEAVPVASQIAARELGITLPEMFDRVGKGAMDATTFLDALARGLEKDFGTAGAEAMNTYAGSVQRFANAWDQFKVAIGDTGVLTAATVSIKKLTDALDLLTSPLKWLGDDARPWNRGGGGGGEHFLDVLEIPQPTIESLQSYAHAVEMAAFDELAVVIPEVGDALGSIETHIVNTVDAMGFLFGEISTRADPALEELETRIVNVHDAMGFYFERVKTATQAQIEIDGALKFSGTQWEAYANSVSKAGNALENIAGKKVKTSDGKILSYAELLQNTGAAQPGAPQGGATQGQSYFQSLAIGAGSQIAGVGGGIQGFMAAGPLGAIAGSLTELLLKNEKMREVIEKLSAIAVELVGPIAEAIAPSLEALAPVLKELAPVFKLAGNALAIYLHPLVVALGMLSRAIDPLTDAIERMIGSGPGQFTNWDKPGKWHFASGGRMNAGQLAMVGENGPELFRPRIPGTIVPARGSGAVTINVMHPDARDVTEMVRRAVLELSYTGRMGLV